MRKLPQFLMQGDPVLERLMPGMRDANARMRAMMGMPRREVAPEEGSAAGEWLRHVEAGRIGGL
jgi:hypothetical protein